MTPNIDFRARLIFGILTLLVLFSTGASVYAGVKSGKLEQNVIKPIKDFWAETSRPEPSINPVVIPTKLSQTPSPAPANKPQVQTYFTPPAPCISKNIREGEFASNKCYSQADYDDLEYYLNRFNSAVFNKDGAQSSMKITCDCSRQSSCDFFKDSCDKDKQQLSQAESDISKYRSIIQGIIAKGR